MLNRIKIDLMGLVNEKINITKIFKLYILNISAKCSILFRIQDYFTERGFILIAKLIRNRNLSLTGAEFCIGCKIEAGLIIKHTHGIVVGGGAVIGKNCTILQQVTIGENYKYGNNDYPTIKNNVTICSGAKVLGGIIIGNNCIIGANAVVLKSFEDKSIIVGSPATCKKQKVNKE